jgi:hypothetical protein
MALKKRKATAGSTQERMRALREKTSRDANRIVSMSNKMAGDLQNAHGTEESVTIMNMYRGLICIYSTFKRKNSLYKTKTNSLYRYGGECDNQEPLRHAHENIWVSPCCHRSLLFICHACVLHIM